MKRLLSLLALLLFSSAAFAVGQVGTATLTSSASSVKTGGQVTLSWSTTATSDGTSASSCTGSWGATGTTLPASGTATVTVTAATTYTLTCTWNDFTSVLTWTAPTMNVDGTAIAGTQLPLSYTVNEGATGAETLLKAGVTAATYSDVATAAGTRCYTIQAVGADSVQGSDTSASTNEVCVVLAPATAMATAAVAVVNPVPSAPTGLTVK